jgi:trafficking protein particle complex subunit 8
MRKQHGHPVFFIQLDLNRSSSMAHEISISPLLPPYGIEDDEDDISTAIASSTSDQNLEEIRVFLREFVTMNLIPWMEKSVLDWSELVSHVYDSPASVRTFCFQFPARRITTRLLSSTRRFFGSSHGQPVSQSLIPSDGPGVTEKSSGLPITLQRRLAEFATILGDHKVALVTWDALRKENHIGLV